MALDNTAIRSISVLAITLLATACQDGMVSPDECWNPKLLRVKIGEEILDLPVGVDVNSKLEGTPDGIVRVRDVPGVSGNRLYCQRKDRVPLEYGSWVTFSMHHRPEQGDYVLGEMMAYPNQDTQRQLEIRRSSTPLFSRESDYLSDYRDAGRARFAGTINRWDDPKRGVIYRFTLGSRQTSSTCQMWPNDPAVIPGGGLKPYSCIPGWSFRMGNLIVSTGAQQEGQIRGSIAPPETWPQKWVQVLNEIASFRVNTAVDAD
jgi:hypothetical protein